MASSRTTTTTRTTRTTRTTTTTTTTTTITTTTKRRQKQLAILLSLQSLFITQFYFYYGCTTRGRQWFRDASSMIMNAISTLRIWNVQDDANDDNAKGGLMILGVLAIPVVVAGGACVLLLTRSRRNSHASAVFSNEEYGDIEAPASSSRECTFTSLQKNNDENCTILSNTSTTVQNRSKNKNNNNNNNNNNKLYKLWCKTFASIFTHPSRFAMAFILVPCLFFFICNVQRHYHAAMASYPFQEQLPLDGILINGNNTYNSRDAEGTKPTESSPLLTEGVVMDAYNEQSTIQIQEQQHQQQQQKEQTKQQSKSQEKRHHRHQMKRIPSPSINLSKTKKWFRQLLTHLANDAAILALLSFSHLLLPVSKHSPLVILMNWSPMQALVIHQWAGRLAILATVMHGGMHLMCAWWRWVDRLAYTSSNDYVYNNVGNSMRSFWYGFLPPIECWKQVLPSWFRLSNWNDINDGSNLGNESMDIVQSKGYDEDMILLDPLDFGHGCVREDDDCVCYDLFVNLTGLLGLVALIVIFISSVGYVRRHHYRVFYLVHISAAPLFVLMAALHYNRTVLYLAPSLLYYSCTTIPTYVQAYLSRRHHVKGTRILSITKIPCPSNQRPHGSVLDITFAASPEAMEQYQPGHYCTMHIPSLSVVAHPFTVNSVVGYEDRLRLLVRQVGPFTSDLVRLLERDEDDPQSAEPLVSSLPAIQINGFQGIPHNFDCHDCVVMAAGGIGITPFLSLVTSLGHSDELTERRIKCELHWVCRDISLIRHVYNEYFSHILQNHSISGSKGPSCLKLTIYYTGPKLNEESPSLESISYYFEEPSNLYETAPMTPSNFSVSVHRRVSSNIFNFITYTSIFSIGLASIWLLFTRMQTKNEMVTRTWACFVLVGISLAISVIANTWITRKNSKRESRFRSDELVALASAVTYGSFPLKQQKQSNVHNSQDATKPHRNNDVTYEFHESGRPTPLTMLSSLKGSKKPALFVCGPKPMTAGLRDALTQMEFDEDCEVYEDVFES